jgi:AcrR family transcriptional regulator
MGEHHRLSKTKRPYRLGVRRDAMDRTRQRITDAAIALHGSVGPAATTMSAVAERAGVTRATLYRHFPTEAELFAACSADWLRANPRPDVAEWARISDPVERIAAALSDLYPYYRSTEGMLGNLYRDITSLPEPIAERLEGYPEDMVEVLDAGWPEGADDGVRRAALLHAVSFATWRSLRRAGLTDDDAARLMTGLVRSAGQPRPASASTSAASVGVEPRPSRAPTRDASGGSR